MIMSTYKTNIHIFNGNSLDLYDQWESPTVIISDGPYGIKGFPGDLKSETGLDDWYEPHIKAWSENQHQGQHCGFGAQNKDGRPCIQFF